MANNGKQQANAVETVQGQIVQANRAPVSTDKGVLWIYYSASAAVLYVRHPHTGTWHAQS